MMPTSKANTAATIAPECFATNLAVKLMIFDNLTAKFGLEIQKDNIAFMCSVLLCTVFVSTRAPQTMFPFPVAGRYSIFGYSR